VSTSQQNQNKTLGWTALLVFVMSVVSFFVLVQPPSHLPETAAAKQSARLRQPASISEVEESIKTNEKNQAIDVPVPCHGENTIDLPATVSQVRLIGTLCLAIKGSADIQTSEIRNELNGFSATTFYPKARAYTTDYITIASGDNHIKIVHQLGKFGREAREFIVHRE
jgi:cytoskeletal protein RodZ